MAKGKEKSVFFCQECGYESAKWLGKCPTCGAWNSFVEDVEESAPSSSVQKRTSVAYAGESHATAFSELEAPAYIRSATGLSELDRVLGGGLVAGSAVLISGEPGIGKSTLLLQICDTLGREKKVLYVSGEESGSQIKLRAERLKVLGGNLYILTETNIENILSEAKKIEPDVIIADSVQTMYSDIISSSPGSVSNVKEVALALIGKEGNGAKIGGIHAEGPFINVAKKGAMNEKRILPPTIETFDRMYDACEGQMKMMTVAPEMDGAIELIKQYLNYFISMIYCIYKTTFCEFTLPCPACARSCCFATAASRKNAFLRRGLGGGCAIRKEIDDGSNRCVCKPERRRWKNYFVSKYWYRSCSNWKESSID